MNQDRALCARAWVIMPDHLHLFFELEQLAIGQVVGRLKVRTRAALRADALAWQGNFYEHRLREGENAEDVLRYLWLNPYRAQLVPPNATYAHFWMCAKDRAWFVPSLDDARPLPEWLT